MRRLLVSILIAGAAFGSLAACEDTDGGTGCQWDANHTTCEPAPAPYWPIGGDPYPGYGGGVGPYGTSPYRGGYAPYGGSGSAPLSGSG